MLDDEMMDHLGDIVADKLLSRQQSEYGEVLRGLATSIEGLEATLGEIQNANRAALDHINARIEALEKDETERVREIVEDLPPGPRTRFLYRPSARVQRQAEDDEPETSDDRAQEALGKLPQYRGV